MELRPYQQEALDAIADNYNKGITKQVISAATGTGKTVIFSRIPDKLKSVLPGQMLVLAHRDELLEQSIEKLKKANPTLKVSKEKAEEVADTDADIIVASVQTIGRKNSNRIKRFNWDNIDKIVTDEAHHATASSYQNIYEEAGILGDTKKLHLGMTATPQRSDGKGLQKIFQKIVYEYSLRQAIENNWLVDVKGIRIATESSLDGVKTQAGDFAQGELADAVNNPERNQRVFQAWKEIAFREDSKILGEERFIARQTIVFTVDIKHAQDMAAMFRHYGIQAEAVWGDDPNRSEKIRLYKSGVITVLCNCGVLTEGFDDPATSCIVLARPTKSAVLYVQMVGRGTRLCEGKVDCIVIDVVDVSSKHSLITLPTLMGMSAALNLKGKSLVGSVQIIERAQEDYAHLDFAGLKDITEIKSYIESVDLFNIKPLPVVQENSELIWQRNATGGFIIQLQNKEKLTIQQDLLDKWVISGTLRGKKYKGERESVSEAFHAADNLIITELPEILKLVKDEQSWHNKPASQAQLKFLAKLLKGKAIPNNIDSGTAHKVINSLLARKG